MLHATLAKSCVFLATVLVVLGAGPAWSAEPAAAGKPNFLVIVADDMGFSDPGCYGGEIATPNLDRLAANGLRYTQMYSTARCWPSRTCLMSGYYAQQLRADPPKGKHPAWARLLPHYLKPAGYRSYQAGKWHVPGAPLAVRDGGFDRSYVIHDHDRFFSPKRATLDDENLPPVEEGTGFYLTTAIADYAISFLKEHQEKHAQQPYLLYLAFTCPHFPLQALQEDIDRYRDKYLAGWEAMRQKRYQRMREMGLVNCDLSPLQTDFIASWSFPEAKLQEELGLGESGYAVPWNKLTDEQKRFQATKMAIHAAMVDRMDREIGRVLEQVKGMGGFDDTAVFFVSDNGASAEQIVRGDRHDKSAPLGSAKSYLCLGPGFSTAANAPFRLHKSWVHEGGIASPLIVHWPKGIQDRGALRHTPGHFIDLVPTLLDLAGVGETGPWNNASPPPLPGRSLVPSLAKDIVIPRDCIYWHHMDNRAIRVGDLKLVSAGGKPTGGTWELYDLKTDRCEMKDLSRERPEKVEQFSALWQKCEDQFREQAGPAEAAKQPAKKQAKKPAPKAAKSKEN